MLCGPSWANTFSAGRSQGECSTSGVERPVVSVAAQPANRFTREDLIRIKNKGPQLADIKLTSIDADDSSKTAVYVPSEDVVPNDNVREPNWGALHQVSLDEFYKELQARNWQHPSFNPASPPWHIQLYKCSGRTVMQPFTGYRALVWEAVPPHVLPTLPARQRLGGARVVWVDIPWEGEPAFFHELTLQQHKDGQAHVSPRVPGAPPTLQHVGVRQVQEQLFDAFQQRATTAAADELSESGYVAQVGVGYDCPGEKLLQVEYLRTPPPAVDIDRTYRKLIPISTVLLLSGFVLGSLVRGVFFPHKGKPLDLTQIFEFAQSKSKARIDQQIATRFSDVAGLDMAKREVATIISFLKNPTEYARLGARPPKGVLLEGPPGCGKTLLAKAIAGESSVPFYQMTGSDFVELIVGVGAARIRDAFRRARVNSPCLLFIDEIDALGVARSSANEQANEEREQALNQLLTEMDGFTPDTGVVIIAATNRADLLDAALLRAGRFDIKIRVTRPDTEGRLQILQVHAKKHPLADDVDLLQLARDLPGLSGADLANVLSVAALEAVREGCTHVAQRHVYSAIDRIIQGVTQQALESQTVRLQVAVHEVGRAVVAQHLHDTGGRIEGVERVSISPRGERLSRTHFLRVADEVYDLPTTKRLLERVQVLLAGYASESVFTQDPSTYASSSLHAAYSLAKRIVTNYGLSRLGITAFAAPPPKPRADNRAYDVQVQNLDLDDVAHDDWPQLLPPSNAMREKVHQEASRIVNEEYTKAVVLLKGRRRAVLAAVEMCLARDQVAGLQLRELLDQHPAEHVPDQPAVGVDASTELLPFRQEHMALRRAFTPALQGTSQGVDHQAVAQDELVLPDVKIFAGTGNQRAGLDGNAGLDGASVRMAHSATAP